MKLISWLLVLASSVFAEYIVGQSYFGSNNHIEYIPGNSPIIIVVPHGGRINPDSLPIVKDRDVDNGTFETSYLLSDSIASQSDSLWPHRIINHLHPSKMMASQDTAIAAGTHPTAVTAWIEFHNFIDSAKAEVTQSWGKGHYFELHGNGHSDKWNEIGLGLSPTILNSDDSVILASAKYSTIKNLSESDPSNALEVIKGETSLGGLLDAQGWKSSPSPAYPSPQESSFFYAGWNTWKHGSRYDGTIDATHLEAYYEFMQIHNRNHFSGDLSRAILTFMEIHYGFKLFKENSNISQALDFKFQNEPTTPLLIEVYSLLGQKLWTASSPTANWRKDLDILPGFYTVKMQTQADWKVNLEYLGF